MESTLAGNNRVKYDAFAQFPEWVGSHIEKDEGWALTQMIAEIKPRVIVEIGVNSGCSTAILAWAMREVHTTAWKETRLHAFDISEFCTFIKDKKIPVGEAVTEMDASLAEWISLHSQETAIQAAKFIEPTTVDFAFIDASHNHPWPTLDLLALLPLLRPGAWVGLHDIRLASIIENERQGANRHGRVRGPAILFDKWSGVKRDGAGLETPTPNLGFIQIPQRLDDAKDWITASLTEEWDVAPPFEALKKLKVKSQHCGLQNGYIISLLENQALMKKKASSKQPPEERSAVRRFFKSLGL